MRKITAEEANKAYEDWGCNCGPAAIAAIAGMTLDDIRPHMGDFEKKFYTNPTLMFDVMKSIGRPWKKIGAQWPTYGLVRIQWEGPWTEPGVPIRARYRQTHWVGTMLQNGRRGIFDINATGNGSGWSSFDDWLHVIVPFIIKTCVPRANGKWHVTHGIEFSN